MKEILYLDVFFIINFLMDLISLSVGSLISSEKIRFLRLIGASFLGGVFSTVMMMFSPGRLMNVFFGMILFLFTVFIAFGKRKFSRFLKVCLFSFATALFLGGAVEAISFYTLSQGGRARLTPGIFLAVAFLALGLFSLWGKSLDRKLRTAVVSLAISVSGRSEYFFGLVDSGLLLRDPVGARPVLLLKAAYATPLLSADFLERIKNGTFSEEENVFLIPTKTASGSGQLYAFLPERICVLGNGKKKKKEHKDVLIALDFSEGGFGGCPCLVPLSVL